jgi:outer membrane receptor protein involved in Fe transport
VPRDIAGGLDSPDLTMVGTANYKIGPYGIQLQQRYISDSLLNVDWVEGIHVDDNTVSSGNYTNLQFNYSSDFVRSGTWNVNFNIQNLFDRPPPIVPSFGGAGNSQTIPNGYEIYGRQYQLSFGMTY